MPTRPSRAFICGCAGLALTPQEIAFYREMRPWGLILFARNCADPDQVRRLIDQFRFSVDCDEAPVLIDQEGGRVQRLRAPHWLELPAAQVIGALYDAAPAAGLQAAQLHGQLLATQLRALNITMNCAPVLDLRFADASAVVGERAYGSTPQAVAALASAVYEGHRQAGIIPVIKHIPGHGRARVDSHKDLPVVDATREELQRTDFVPFRKLAHARVAMTAHVVYSAIDAQHPATQSATVIKKIVRNSIGFKGLLLSDDLSMQALTGSLDARARAAREAGCDVVLHCNGVMEEMQAVAAAAGVLAGPALTRASAVQKCLDESVDIDINAASCALNALLTAEAPGHGPMP